MRESIITIDEPFSQLWRPFSVGRYDIAIGTRNDSGDTIEAGAVACESHIVANIAHCSRDEFSSYLDGDLDLGLPSVDKS